LAINDGKSAVLPLQIKGKNILNKTVENKNMQKAQQHVMNPL